MAATKTDVCGAMARSEDGSLDELETLVQSLRNMKSDARYVRRSNSLQLSPFDELDLLVREMKKIVLTNVSEMLDETEKKLETLTSKTVNKSKKTFVNFEEFQARKEQRAALARERIELEKQRGEFLTATLVLDDALKKLKTHKTCGSNVHVLYDLAKEYLKEFRRMKTALPIYAWRTDIVEAVRDNQMIVLKGETGSGKSTQLGQYLLDAGFAKDGKKIICTQPRKVAAVSLAERVAEEMCCPLGSEIGYSVGLNKKYHETITKLLFMTDRMLLNHCLIYPNLDDIAVVIIDEAHERTMNTDILLGMVKKALQSRPHDLKVIVTSATISTELFSAYFYDCPVLNVQGRNFPVEIIYQQPDDVSFNFGNEGDHVSSSVNKALEIHKSESDGDILIFLTSPLDIERAVENFEKRSSSLKKPCLVLPLHGKLQPEEQMKVFEAAPEGSRKIVFSTNIAETSITISGKQIL